MERLNIVDLEKKTIELLNQIQDIKVNNKIIPHDISFRDIENIQSALSSLAVYSLSDEDVENKILNSMNLASASLWKIRKYLLLDDDDDYQIQRLKEKEDKRSLSDTEINIIETPPIEKEFDNVNSSDFNKTLSEISLGNLLAFIMGDIDIFLLKEEDQMHDKTKLFSVSEVREQLIKTTSKFSDILKPFLNIPISKASRLFLFLKPHSNLLSENEKEEFIQKIYKNQ